MTELQNEILAILFAAGEPMEPERIAQVLSIETPAAREQLFTLAELLEEGEGPLTILPLEGCYQLTTKLRYAPIIKTALEVRRNVPLSQAALEVLAIIAYNQPTTRAFIEQVRGVDSSSVVASLVEKELVEEAGRLELPGRPIAYKTTPNFLRCFGLGSLEDLPTVVAEEPESGEQLAFEEIQ